MSHIVVKDINMTYPVYGANTRSLKQSIAKITTGGTLSSRGDTGNVAINALKNVSFELKKGDRLGLIGHNGAGKSSLLKLLAGIYEPESGSLDIVGSITSMLDLNFCMQPELTGYENIRVSSIILEKHNICLDKVTQDIEEFTELGNFLAMPIKTYSSGMSVRLAFAIATAFEPDILLVDEVIGAGDATFMAKALKRMKEYVSQSNILILSSHANDMIKKFFNKVLWLEHGHIKTFGEVHYVLRQYEASI